MEWAAKYFSRKPREVHVCVTEVFMSDIISFGNATCGYKELLNDLAFPHS